MAFRTYTTAQLALQLPSILISVARLLFPMDSGDRQCCLCSVQCSMRVWGSTLVLVVDKRQADTSEDCAAKM